jgi:hypothetical protein
MSVEEAIGLTQMAFRSLELRLFEGGAISVIDGAKFVRPEPAFRAHGTPHRGPLAKIPAHPPNPSRSRSRSAT